MPYRGKWLVENSVLSPKISICVDTLDKKIIKSDDLVVGNLARGQKFVETMK